ncbi:hypothetical protein ONZ45_g14010 [Pleurotus djamor]|nr:hypothetical protein ONZ45_g14010 [Pleurotus djamor]
MLTTALSRPPLSMSHDSALPQEIYGIIIANLCDEKPLLKACSLVASTWRIASQKHLHRTIVLWTSLTYPNPPKAQYDEYEEQCAVSPASGLGKTRLLLTTSSPLLRYARSIVIRGECIPTNRGRSMMPMKPLKTRAPDPSLVVLLSKIHNLSLPLLTNVELRDLVWTAMDLDLQRALVSLLSGDFIENVTLHGCDIPYGLPWFRFVGPQTRSLTLNGVLILGDTSVLYETSLEEIPISSASNLTHLSIGQYCSPSVNQWILHDTPSSRSQMLLRSGSCRNRLTTLSIHCGLRARAEGLLELVQAYSSLTTLKLNPETCLTHIPFYEILRIPTLQNVVIMPVSSRQIRWLISCFKPSNPLSSYPFRDVPSKPKTVCIEMSVESSYPGAGLASIDLDTIREFDGVVSNIPNVEVYLRITLSTLDGPERMQYEETKKTLVGLQADMKALKLEVS